MSTRGSIANVIQNGIKWHLYHELMDDCLWIEISTAEWSFCAPLPEALAQRFRKAAKP